MEKVKMKENKIIQLTPILHIKTRPGMYIGGTSEIEEEKLMFNPTIKTFEYRKVRYVPGLLKIINEIFDNSFDEYIRTNGKFANKIDVAITNSSVSITDNGRGVPQENNEKGIPQAVIAFTEPFAGTNFVDETKALASIGMNGVGSVATNVFSKYFNVHTYNGKTHLMLICKNNVTEIKYDITKSKNKNGTEVYFEPDFDLFDVDSLSSEYVDLIRNRIIHLAKQFDIEFILKYDTNEENINDLF